MQVTDTLIRNVVQEVLAHLKNGQTSAKPIADSGNWGIFDSVDEAVKAASTAQREFQTRGLQARKKAVDCIRKICIDKADMLGLEELEETKIGRLKHKVEKLITCAEKTLGVEFLRTDAFSGDYGVTVQEYAPFGADFFASAEIFEPLTSAWNRTGQLITGRDQHATATLPNGTVIVAGGVDRTSEGLGSAELFTP